MPFDPTTGDGRPARPRCRQCCKPVAKVINLGAVTGSAVLPDGSLHRWTTHLVFLRVVHVDGTSCTFSVDTREANDGDEK